MATKTLILVDFQNEWLDKKSADYIGNISPVLTKTNKLIDSCRAQGYTIIFTRHVEKDAKDAWSEKSAGTKLIAGLHRKTGDTVITKHKISPFYQTALEKNLKNINEIIVCGILTNLCVRSMVQDAYDRDFDIKVIKDCCAAFDAKTQKFTFEDLKNTREEVEFLNLSDFTS